MKLYKYCNFESATRILGGLSLKVSPPIEFNDPFELTPATLSLSPEVHAKRMAECSDYVRAVYNATPEPRPELPDFTRDFEKMALAALKGNPEPFEKTFAEHRSKLDLAECEEASQHLGILCLSTFPDSIPMWSYYADHHRGVVIELDGSQKCFQSAIAQDHVSYPKERMPWDPQYKIDSEEGLSQTFKLIFTKSEAWEPESEYRFVFRLEDLEPRSGFYLLPVDGQAITSVFLGCRTPGPDLAALRAIILGKSELKHVAVSRFERDAKEFKLIPKLLPAPSV